MSENNLVKLLINSEKSIEKPKSYAKVLIVLNESIKELEFFYKSWSHIKDKVNTDGMPHIKYINSKYYLFEEAYWDNFGLMSEKQYMARNRVYELINWMRNNIESGNFYYVNIEESHKEK